MLTIGILGGMSWESSAHYYRLLNEGAAARLGGLHSAEILLRSLDFEPIERLQRAGDWAAAADLLGDAAVALERGGADLLVLATNTMHKVAHEVAGRLHIPLLHIADVAGRAARARGLATVGLLGTNFTMSEPFYRERLERHGLRVVVPGEADRETIHRIIYDELCRGVFSDASRAAYEEVIGRLVRDGAQGVILGCTEIELLLPLPTAHGVPLLPTTALHVEAALDAALGAPQPSQDDAVAAFWVDARIHAHLNRLAAYWGPVPLDTIPPPASMFGATKEVADELADLIASGVKTATASARWEYDAEGVPLPEVGGLEIVLDGSGRPRALIETTEVTFSTFSQVSAAHAAAEGEGDRSLEHWRRVHREFFTTYAAPPGGFDEELPLVLQRFKVLYVAP